MSRCSSIMLMICFSVAACTDDAMPDNNDLIPGWESAETTVDDGSIIIQKVSYRSGGLRIFGQVCRPVGAGPFPLIVENHGGVTGLPSWGGGSCAETARAGQIQIESSYRGQDGSGGYVELCLGEVDDVLHMLDIALMMPQVDRNRVAMWGSSLGGCVTTRAVQRGAPVKAAASVYGITSMKEEYEFWRAQLAAGTGPIVQYKQLVDLADAGIGGPPSDFPDDYARRSTLDHAAEIPATMPYLMAHGVADLLVPPRQSCELAQRLGIQGHHFDEAHQLVTTVPVGCETLWTASTSPLSSWSGNRYLLVYDGVANALVGGGTETAVATAMEFDVTSFLNAKLH
jgi:hypothetical protein